MGSTVRFEIRKAFVTDLVLPLALVLGLLVGNFASVGEWFLMSIGAASFVLYAFLTAGWDVCGYHVRSVMLVRCSISMG
jgi:hypothetical protein